MEPQEQIRAEQPPESSIETLIKKMTEDITHSIQISMATFSQTIEEKLSKLNEDVTHIQSRINNLEASSSSHITPSVNLE